MHKGSALILALLGLCNGPSMSQSTVPPFVVTQSMSYKGSVDVSSYGVPQNPIIYESSLLFKERDDWVPDAALAAFTAKLPNGSPLPTVIDIERWPLLTKDDAARAERVKKLLGVLKRLRQMRPDMKFGFYGVVPERTYWPLVDKNQRNERRQWEESNQKAKSDLAQYVDAIFPSLYTFYDDQTGWEIYAKETLIESRQFGKPVYCFLWPQYHSSNPLRKGQYLAPDYWRLELETCRKYADGIVIWNYDPTNSWNPEAAWWKETVRFLKSQTQRRGPR